MWKGWMIILFISAIFGREDKSLPELDICDNCADACSELKKGLDLHLEFDETQEEFLLNGYYRDLSRYGRHARPHGKTYMHGIFTSEYLRDGDIVKKCWFRALHLRGRMHTDHLVISNSRGVAGVDLGISFTMAVWFQLSAAGDHWQTIMDNGVSGVANPAYGLRVLGNTLAVDFWGDSQAVAHNYPYEVGRGSNKPESSARAEVTVPMGAWTHAAVVISEDGRASFYVNGLVVFSEQFVGSTLCGSRNGGKRDWMDVCHQIDPIAPQHELWVGREAPMRHNANARAFQGDMDDLRVYSQRALSAVEVQTLFLMGSFRRNGTRWD